VAIGRLSHVEARDRRSSKSKANAEVFPRAGRPVSILRRSASHDHSGLGLGLSIARKAVRAHEGDILVRNMPGKGCVFAIDVPLAAEAAGARLFA